MGDARFFGASQALLTAALSGLLCVAAAACDSIVAPTLLPADAAPHAEDASTQAASDAARNDTSEGTTDAGAPVGEDGGGDADADADASTVADARTPVAHTSCDGGVLPDAGITSTTHGPVTLDEFTALCDAKQGIVEIEPHCGGSNGCRGMSYDSTTQTLTEHTCRGTNTCAGYSCVVCD